MLLHKELELGEDESGWENGVSQNGGVKVYGYSNGGENGKGGRLPTC